MITILFRDQGVVFNDVYPDEETALRNVKHYNDIVDIVEGVVTGRDIRRLRKEHNTKGGARQTCACLA